MDGQLIDLTIFAVATFAAALVAGLAGFAFGLVAAAAWLHVLTPVQTASLIVSYGLIVQGLAVWKLRRALSWSLLWPLMAGAAVGVPVGTSALLWITPHHLRLAIGILLVVYSVYSLTRPTLKPFAVGRAVDLSIGFVNGALGGMTGFAGIVVTIWSGLRGWSKDVQRTVFQPVSVATFAMSAAWIGVAGAISAATLKLFAIGLPPLLAGTWLGLKLYGHLIESDFRRVVLILLLASGATLIVATLLTASS